MGNENFTSAVRRAERRIGRPFLSLMQKDVMASSMRRLGLRVSRDEFPGPIGVWVLAFGRIGEEPTRIYGRTIEQALSLAANPPREVARKKRRQYERRVG